MEVQFVAELLQRSGIMKWKKQSSLYLPNQMRKELSQHVGLKETLVLPCIEALEEESIVE